LANVYGRFTFIAHRPATPCPISSRTGPAAVLQPETHTRTLPPTNQPHGDPVLSPTCGGRLEYSRSETQTSLHIQTIAIRTPGDLCVWVCRAAAINIYIYIMCVYVYMDGKSLFVSTCTGIFDDANEPSDLAARGTDDGFIYSVIYFLNNEANPSGGNENYMFRVLSRLTTI